MATHVENALRLIGDSGVLRPRDLRRAGIPNVILTRLLERELVRRVVSATDGATLLGYSLSDGPTGPEDVHRVRLAEISVMHPAGVLCYQSALRFHGFTDDFESGMQVAVRPGASRRTSVPQLKVVYWHNDEMFRLGVVQESLDGVPCRVTDPHRTVADLFGPHGTDHAGERTAAMSALVATYGQGGLVKASGYASALGWGSRMKEPVQSFMEGMKCAVTPRP